MCSQGRVGVIPRAGVESSLKCSGVVCLDGVYRAMWRCSFSVDLIAVTDNPSLGPMSVGVGRVLKLMASRKPWAI